MWVEGDSLYIWRHRNDQIHLRHSARKSSGHRSGEFLDAYDKCLHIIKPEDKDLRFALDHYLMNFFWRKYPARILRENAPKFAKAMAKYAGMEKRN